MLAYDNFIPALDFVHFFQVHLQAVIPKKAILIMMAENKKFSMIEKFTCR